jgi:hypothetical protein
VRFFRRKYALTVDTIRTTDLDIEFKVERTLGKSANTAEITIYGLTADHRHRLCALRRVGVRLEAGYEDEIGLIFAGDLRTVVVEREGADWKTKLTGDDGGPAIRGARVNVSHGPGATVEAVLTDAARAMGVGLGNAMTAVRNGNLEGAWQVFVEGVVASGPASRELDGLLASTGHEWSIQNGALQVLRRGQALGGFAYRLSPETGLLDSPSVAKGVLKAKTLMLPQLGPGQPIVVDCETLHGAFRVTKVTINGDTAGDDWGCELEGKVPTA